MQKGDCIEVEWTLDAGEQVWWPALVWSACPTSGTLQLAYAPAHGHPAHLAACCAVDDHHLLDAEHQLVLRHRPAAEEPVFSIHDIMDINQGDLESEELEEAQRMLQEDVPLARQQRLWEGMEAFRERTRAALQDLGGEDVTAADVRRRLGSFT